VNINCILTKLGTKMRHCTTFLCTKFHGNQITCFHFMVTFTPLQKEEKKGSNQANFWKLISRKCLVQFSWNLECGYWQWRVSPQQKSSGFVYAAQSYIYMKILSLFFTHGCCAPVSWAARHTTVCLDYSIKAFISAVQTIRLGLKWPFKDFS